MQQIAVLLIVAASAAYAAWALMPQAWRRWLAQRLLGREPVAVRACGGCDGCAAAAPPRPQTVTVHRRLPDR